MQHGLPAFVTLHLHHGTAIPPAAFSSPFCHATSLLAQSCLLVHSLMGLLSTIADEQRRAFGVIRVPLRTEH